MIFYLNYSRPSGIIRKILIFKQFCFEKWLDHTYSTNNETNIVIYLYQKYECRHWSNAVLQAIFIVIVNLPKFSRSFVISRSHKRSLIKYGRTFAPFAEFCLRISQTRYWYIIYIYIRSVYGFILFFPTGCWIFIVKLKNLFTVDGFFLSFSFFLTKVDKP